MRVGFGSIGAVDVTDRITRDVGYTADRWLRELRAGRAFTGGAIIDAAAGQVPEVQLFNPAASLITIIVRSIVLSQGANDVFQVRTFNTALATLATAGVNLLAGGAAASGQVRTASVAAADGTLVGSLRGATNQPAYLNREWAWELGAAEGILFAVTNVTGSLSAMFEWIEV